MKSMWGFQIKSCMWPHCFCNAITRNFLRRIVRALYGGGVWIYRYNWKDVTMDRCQFMQLAGHRDVNEIQVIWRYTVGGTEKSCIEMLFVSSLSVSMLLLL